jgi:hypothetical protein
LNPKVIILGNDWGQIGKTIIKDSKRKSIPTVCIQEGAVNVGYPSSPLHHADYIFILGKVMKNYLLRKNIFITGNPKFRLVQEFKYPNSPTVMINCNFGYHLRSKKYETKRMRWLLTSIKACEKLGLKYFISQHPADITRLDPKWTVIHSKASLMQDQLEKSTIIISQRSTVIYEAFCLGRQVVYYDFPEPYQKTNIILDDPFNAIYYVQDEKQLEIGISKAIVELFDNQLNRLNYLAYHCNIFDDTDDPEKIIMERLNEVIEPFQ